MVKHQKISTCYNDCLQSFLFAFHVFLTAPIAKNGHILSKIYVIFLKNKLESLLLPHFYHGVKIGKAVTNESGAIFKQKNVSGDCLSILNIDQ